MVVILSSLTILQFLLTTLTPVLSFSSNQGWRKCVCSCSQKLRSLYSWHTMSPGWEMPMTGQLVCKNILFLHMHLFRWLLCVNVHIPQLGAEMQVQSPSVICRSQCQGSLCPVCSFLGELCCSKALGTNSFSQPNIFGSRFSLHICTACTCCVITSDTRHWGWLAAFGVQVEPS